MGEYADMAIEQGMLEWADHNMDCCGPDPCPYCEEEDRSYTSTLKGQPMPEHDNKNTGGAWATKAVKGSLDVQGRKYYIDIVQTGRESPAPLYNMYVTSADTKKLYACGLFPPKGESTAKAKGVLNLYDCGGEFWINLFVNEPDPEHPRRPVVGLTVQAKAQEAAAPPPPAPEPGPDNIPF